MTEFQFNTVPALVTALGYWVFGGIWWGGLFGKTYEAAMGLSPEAHQMRRRVFPMALFMYLIVGIVIAFFIDNFATMLGAATWQDGAMLGLYFWVAFVLTGLVNGRMFELRSDTLFLINAGGSLISFVGMGAALAMWN